LAFRSAVIPLSLPSAEPSSVRPPPHAALNVPAAAVSVISVIFHSTLPHDPGLNEEVEAVAAEVQLPVARTLATSDGDAGPSCRVSTHATKRVAARANPIANVTAVARLPIIYVLHAVLSALVSNP
jgi:hypothetical protein